MTTTSIIELADRVPSMLRDDSAWTRDNLLKLGAPASQIRAALYELNGRLLAEAESALNTMSPADYRVWVVANRTGRAAIDRRLSQVVDFERTCRRERPKRSTTDDQQGSPSASPRPATPAQIARAEARAVKAAQMEETRRAVQAERAARLALRQAKRDEREQARAKRKKDRQERRLRLVEEAVVSKLRFSGDLPIGSVNECRVVHANARAQLPSKCAHCGAVGVHLDAALSHETPFKRLKVNPRGGSRYSVSVDDYLALCRVCHRRYDTHIGERSPHCKRGHPNAERSADGSCPVCHEIKRIFRLAFKSERGDEDPLQEVA